MAKVKKYIFVRGANPSVVWDPIKGRPLAEFCDTVTKRVTGVFVTRDKKVADKLKELGYKERKDFPIGAPMGGFEEKIPPPPTHITPGGPTPEKQADIDIEEDEVDEIEAEDVDSEDLDKTVTDETFSETEDVPSVSKVKPKKKLVKPLKKSAPKKKEK